MILRRLLGLPQRDVDAPHVRAPTVVVARVAEVVAHIGQPPVVLILIRVGGGVWIGIARLPKRSNELVALLIGVQLQKLRSLLLTDNVRHILLQPEPVVRRELLGRDGL